MTGLPRYYTDVLLEQDRRYRGRVYDAKASAGANPVYVTCSYATWDDANSIARRLAAMWEEMVL